MEKRLGREKMTVVRLSPKLHRQLKLEAARRGTTMSKLASDALLASLAKPAAA